MTELEGCNDARYRTSLPQNLAAPIVHRDSAALDASDTFVC